MGQWHSLVCSVSLLLPGTGRCPLRARDHRDCDFPGLLPELELNGDVEIFGGKYSGARDWCLILLPPSFLSSRVVEMQAGDEGVGEGWECVAWAELEKSEIEIVCAGESFAK